MKLLTNELDFFFNPMKIKEAMSRMPPTVEPETSIHLAKNRMEEAHLDYLPVLEGDRLVGVISDQDIRTAEIFHGPNYLAVKDAMSTDILSVSPEAALCDVLNEMTDRKHGAALIVNPQEVLIGIFTTRDAIDLLKSVILLGAREQDNAEFFETETYEQKAA